MMKIHLNDPYWTQIITPAYFYEVDFNHILDRIMPIDYFFIDCGANFGYWSILQSSNRSKRREVLAVEPVSWTFEILLENCKINQNRFTCLRLGISQHSDKIVRIYKGSAHFAASISFDESISSGYEEVKTISLDDLMERHGPSKYRHFVVKLDVEGQEINALKGAKKLMEKDVLFYYEDHGSDRKSLVTDFIIHETDFIVFFCDKKGKIKQIKKAEQATDVKKNKKLGYNFMALKKSSDFLTLIRAKPSTNQ
jgi:FkbM family methyltransferase